MLPTIDGNIAENTPVDSDKSLCFAETMEKNRGRYEHKRCWVFNDIYNRIDPEDLWSGLKQCAAIQRDRLIGTKQTTEIHFYISSRVLSAQSMLSSVRHHWSIENGQHRTLDVSFGEDASKIHERTATKNVATIRRCCFNVHKLSCRYETKSMARRLKLAGMDDNYRTELILEKF